ncbi:basic helix-loop-helix ARNT-like protein 1 [Littorina saxatilis]|uniref:basic helix-loop-helix ARNT-like protein 1 n=1 Tax=Littorina saxatilis TaxID=31220 RepID=UPI0038B576B4
MTRRGERKGEGYWGLEEEQGKTASGRGGCGVGMEVLSTKEKVETDVYRFKLKDGKFLHLKSTCFGFRNPWTKEVEYIVSTNSVVQGQEVTSSGQGIELPLTIPDEEDFTPMDLAESSQPPKSVFIPGLLGGIKPGAGRIGKQIAEECLEQLNKTPHVADSSDFLNPIQPRPSSSKATATATTSHSLVTPPSTTNNHNNNNNNNNNNSNSRWATDNSRMVPTSHNGINVKLSSQGGESSEEPSLFENVLQEQTMDSIQNPGNDGNDEAALAFLMSLLEADAGLGGPVDFNDLPWPL